MKKIVSLLMTLVLVFSLAACTSEPVATTGQANPTQTNTEDNTVVRLMALMGPTGMGLAELYHNDAQGSGNRADYTVDLVTSAEITNIAAAITQGNCDIAAVPINLASSLYAKTGGKIQVLCANTLGVLHLLENGNSIQSVKDLKGKTVYATGQGSTPEYVLRYVLKENGIDPDTDLNLVFVADHTELASMMAANQYALGMLPEPNVSSVLTANPSFRVALDMTEEWNRIAGNENTLVQGVFIVRKDFAQAHPALVEAFLDDYNASQASVNENPETGAQYIVEAGILSNAVLAKKAIPGCHITFLEGGAMKSAVSKCLNVLFEAAPASVGNALPGDDFYFARG